MKKAVVIIIISVAVISGLIVRTATKLIYKYFTMTEYTTSRESYTSPFTTEEEKEIEALLKVNDDYIGWIYYADAGIDNPIVQESEEGEYINKTFEDEESSVGTIFILNEEEADFSQLNTFIYGNNNSDGSMFGSLDEIYQYTSEYYIDPYIYIYTKDGETLTYRVFSIYTTTSDSIMYQIPLTTSACKEYIQNSLKLGSLESYISFTSEEQKALKSGANIITLSTTYGTDKRLLVQAVLIESK